MATQPYPADRVGAVYDVPAVDPASYDATGLATEAGPVTNIPLPSGDHPAAYSGITSVGAMENPADPNTAPETYER